MCSSPRDDCDVIPVDVADDDAAHIDPVRGDFTTLETLRLAAADQFDG